MKQHNCEYCRPRYATSERVRVAYRSAPTGRQPRRLDADAAEQREMSWCEILDQVVRGRRVVDFHGLWTFAEDDFLAYAEDLAEHRRQLMTLDRCEIRIRASTPWGPAQFSQIYADGVVFHSTAWHGGFHLSDECNALVHAAWRNADGWYEEDYQWARVAAAFPDLFTGLERRCADELLRRREPDVHEQLYGAGWPGRSAQPQGLLA